MWSESGRIFKASVKFWKSMWKKREHLLHLRKGVLAQRSNCRFDFFLHLFSPSFTSHTHSFAQEIWLIFQLYSHALFFIWQRLFFKPNPSFQWQFCPFGQVLSPSPQQLGLSWFCRLLCDSMTRRHEKPDINRNPNWLSIGFRCENLCACRLRGEKRQEFSFRWCKKHFYWLKFYARKNSLRNCLAISGPTSLT